MTQPASYDGAAFESLALKILGEFQADPPALAWARVRCMNIFARIAYVVAELKIADLLQEAPRTSAELARLTGTHETSLFRVMRALASAGVFTEDAQARFALTPMGRLLCSDAPEGARALMLENNPTRLRPFDGLLETVKTGQPTFERVTGQSYFDSLRANPRDGQGFDLLMTQSVALRAGALMATYDFSRVGRVIDVGGGEGGLAAALLEQHPSLKATVLDLPGAIENARLFLGQRQMLDRCELVAGSFFEAIPAGGDVYVLAWILHDWDAARCEQVLRTCRKAMGPDARLLLIERVRTPGKEPSLVEFSDVELMEILPGEERSEETFRAMLSRTGFELLRHVPTPYQFSLLEASPV